MRLFTAAGAAGMMLTVAMSVQAQTKPKLLVLTDIGGDPDDQQAMVRLMAYNNQFDIVGLVATSRMGHGQDTKPGLIQDIVNAYGQSYTNFATHASGYAPANQLLSVVKSGTVSYNASNPNTVFGAGKSTAGSNQIIGAVDAATSGQPVNISIWGGAADLAQALYDVRATRSTAQLEQFMSRMRVYAIGDQDGTGAWINSNFRDLNYILSTDVKSLTTGSTLSQSAPTRGMYQNQTRANNGTSARQVVANDQLGLVKKAWVDSNVRAKGALGAQYPVTGIWQGPTGGVFTQNNATEGLKEGDTPSWTYFLPNGLNVPDQPTWGGWGGRYEASAGNPKLLLSAQDKHYSGNTDIALETVWTIARHRQAMQNDFAARMNWAVTSSFSAANHAPVSPVQGLYGAVTREVASDQSVSLSGAGWTDPDGDNLTYRWWYYADASTTDLTPLLVDPTQRDLQVVLPNIPDGAQLHFILEVTDVRSSGVAMTSYQRTVVTVVPTPAALSPLLGAGALLMRRGRSARDEQK